jgi:predicted ATP-dependent protease
MLTILEFHFLEFLQLVASEANDICSKESKSLIAAEHIMKALQNLGFNEYMDEVNAYYAKLKKESAERSEKSKASSNTEGMTEEELYAQQQALFDATN